MAVSISSWRADCSLGYPGFLTGSDECGLITGVGSRLFHHGMMARRAGERGERMFGVMGEVSVGRGGCRWSGLRLGRSGRRRAGGDDQAGMGEPPLGGSWAS